MMTPDELRQSYLNFFANHGHAVLPSAALVPEDDPTTLFTGSGMQPLLPYFLGQPHPKGTRVVDSQKCFRSQDIEEVGDNRHTTFFEMLGNWSFGDYFKEEQLTWFFTFLTDVVKIDPQHLYVSAYAGNSELGIPQDTQAAEIWKKLFSEKGITDQRVFFYGNENWWSRAGEPANMTPGEPGGPDSEVFYDFGPELKLHENSPFADQACHINCDCGRYLEIGNSVFMTYVRTETGFEELENKNIDFGGGFGRILAAMNQNPDVFTTDLFTPIISYLEEKSAQKYTQNKQTAQAFRVIADHMKAATMLAADGVFPSNKEQGYFSRRLIRRAIRYGQMIGIQHDFVSDLVPIIANIYQVTYPKVLKQASKIQHIFEVEEKKFKAALDKGLRIFSKEASQKLTAKTAFNLYESYGFPLEMSLEEAKNKDIEIESNIEKLFEKQKQAHADQSRTAAVGKFKGGLGDDSQATIRYHTSTHLLHAALRNILGKQVQQKGSNINAKRLRFDFSFDRALTPAEKEQVESQVNTWIQADLPVTKAILPKQEALDSGAVAFFIEKYPDTVTVYTVGRDQKTDWISKEFCGGPHVTHTGEIGEIEVFKEQSSGAGVRRIYARFK